MTRAAVSQATISRAERAKIIAEAMRHGYRIRVGADGTIDATPPGAALPPADPFDLVDMSR